MGSRSDPAAFRLGEFSDGTRYLAFGSGERPLVVINGGNAFVRRFTPERARRDAVRIARLVPDGFRVYVLLYDPLPSQTYAVDSNAAAIAALIRSEFGTATVMGISFGAFVALRLASEAPDAVGELILLVGAHRFSAEGRQRVGRQLEDAARGDFVAMAKPFLSLFRRPWLNAASRVGLWLRRRRLQGSMNSPETIVGMLRAALHEDEGSDPHRLQPITARTLIIGGTADQFFDVAAFRETAGSIRGAELALLDRETHMLPIESPGAVARLIATFLRAGKHAASV